MLLILFVGRAKVEWIIPDGEMPPRIVNFGDMFLVASSEDEIGFWRWDFFISINLYCFDLEFDS